LQYIVSSAAATVLGNQIFLRRPRIYKALVLHVLLTSVSPPFQNHEFKLTYLGTLRWLLFVSPGKIVLSLAVVSSNMCLILVKTVFSFFAFRKPFLSATGGPFAPRVLRTLLVLFRMGRLFIRRSSFKAQPLTLSLNTLSALSRALYSSAMLLKGPLPPSNDHVQATYQQEIALIFWKNGLSPPIELSGYRIQFAGFDQ
jgi:hypothetical protein